MPSVEEFWGLQLAHPEMVLHPLKARDKVPLIPGWQKLQGTPFSMANEIKKGCNIGLVCGKASNITAIDLDSLLFQNEIFNGITELNTLRSRRTEGRGHVYFKYNPNLPASKHHNLGIEVMSDGNNIVLPPSIHPSGDVYKWENINAPIIEMPKLIEDNLKALFKTEQELKHTLAKCRHCFKSLLTSKPSISGGDGHEYMLAISADIKANGGTEDQIIMLAKVLYGDKYDRELTLKEWRNVDESRTWSCDTLRAKLPSYINLEECAKCQKAKKFQQKQQVSQNNIAFEYIDRIIEKNPIYYDKSGQFWLWSDDGFYVPVDKTDILLTVLTGVCDPRIIEKSFKGEIVEAAKLRGRDAKVKPVPNTWIHTKSGVFDIKTNRIYEPSPEYLLTAPIPHRISGKEDTPTIDTLFSQWVIPEKIQLLYEIAAYCLYNGYPIHRMFILFGRGRNGKGQYRDLITKFIGDHNRCSTTMEQLINSRFESGRLFNKKICSMGELNYALLERTAILKMLSGGDPIPGENKGGSLFEFVNTAKLLINTNSLPQTSDKTDAWYARCVTIEFLNQFPVGKDIISTIPEDEYDNLLTKCIRILKELLDRGDFTGTGDIKAREMEYERLSNPLTQFINNHYEKDINGVVAAWRMMEEYISYCEMNGFIKPKSKNSFNEMLRVNYEVEKESMYDDDEKKTVCWAWVKGLKKKNLSNLSNLSQVPLQTPIEKSSEILDKTDKTDKNVPQTTIDNSNQKLTEINTVTEVTQQHEKLHPHTQLLMEAEEWIKSHGPINSSNVTEVTLWYCGRHPEVKNPSEIKTLLEYKYATTKRSEKIKAVN